jgi:hypothetical protein
VLIHIPINNGGVLLLSCFVCFCLFLAMNAVLDCKVSGLAAHLSAVHYVRGYIVHATAVMPVKVSREELLLVGFVS